MGPPTRIPPVSGSVASLDMRIYTIGCLESLKKRFDAGLARFDAKSTRLGATTPARGVLRGSTLVFGGACIQDGRFALPPLLRHFNSLYAIHTLYIVSKRA